MPAIVRQNPALFLLIAGMLVLQLLFVFFFPVVADEAYFVSWGQFPGWGYYDHPPLTGWVAALFSSLEHSALVLRILSMMLGIYLAILLFHCASVFVDEKSALQLTIAWWALPVNLLVFSQYLNDTLVYVAAISFVVFSFYAWRSFNRKDSTRSLGFAVLAGLFLGLALLTKYLAALYVIALVVLFVIHLKVNLGFVWRRLSIVAAVSTALFAINLYWNYYHCQINLAFNFLYREPGEPLAGSLELLGSVVFILGPCLFWRLLRCGFAVASLKDAQRFWSPMFFLTLAVALLVAISKGHFGLHWAMPLCFLAVMHVASEGDRQACRSTMRSSLGFMAVILIMISVLVGYIAIGTPGLSEKKQARLATTLAFYRDLENGSVETQLQDKFAGFKLASSSYSLVAMLGNHDLTAILLFNVSKYGRNHDIFIDYAAYDGDSFLLFSANQQPDLNKYRAYFHAVDLVKLQGQVGSYTLVRARGFDYPRYQQEIIGRIVERYYSHPLQYSGSCYMQKYLEE